MCLLALTWLPAHIIWLLCLLQQLCFWQIWWCSSCRFWTVVHSCHTSLKLPVDGPSMACRSWHWFGIAAGLWQQYLIWKSAFRSHSDCAKMVLDFLSTISCSRCSKEVMHIAIGCFTVLVPHESLHDSLHASSERPRLYINIVVSGQDWAMLVYQPIQRAVQNDLCVSFSSMLHMCSSSYVYNKTCQSQMSQRCLQFVFIILVNCAVLTMLAQRSISFKTNCLESTIKARHSTNIRSCGCRSGNPAQLQCIRLS